MKTNNKSCIAAFIIITVFVISSVYAGDPNETKTPATQQASMAKADAIYNDIMSSLPAELKIKIDTSRADIQTDNQRPSAVDSASATAQQKQKTLSQRDKEIEELPAGLRQQVEATIREMENRQAQRALEFKEMKRGR
jgi:hypothetical protein